MDASENDQDILHINERCTALFLKSARANDRLHDLARTPLADEGIQDILRKA